MRPELFGSERSVDVFVPAPTKLPGQPPHECGRYFCPCLVKSGRSRCSAAVFLLGRNKKIAAQAEFDSIVRVYQGGHISQVSPITVGGRARLQVLWDQKRNVGGIRRPRVGRLDDDLPALREQHDVRRQVSIPLLQPGVGDIVSVIPYER